MRLRRDLHLGYCTNIHRGETWSDLFAALKRHTLAVRDRVANGQAYGIGLRLGVEAVRDLQDRQALLDFQRWLGSENCYIFTINGFPYGQFHGARVKENVYRPDWATTERLEYTKALFDLLGELVPPGGEGSVSTLPLSFKGFGAFDPAKKAAVIANLSACAAHIDAVSARTGRELHLGLEPEPLCTLETSAETVDFLAPLPSDLKRVIGVNYDACHLAIEFEEAPTALAAFRQAGIRISKFHLSSALRLQPTAEALAHLAAFTEDTYLHQVIVRPGTGGALRRYRDLPDALEAVAAGTEKPAGGDEWRVHFHVPVHAHPELVFADTRDHIGCVLDALARDPDLCHHLEIETYTWGVLPSGLRQPDVVDQIAAEYRWVLDEMSRRGLASSL